MEKSIVKKLQEADRYLSRGEAKFYSDREAKVSAMKLIKQMKRWDKAKVVSAKARLQTASVA